MEVPRRTSLVPLAFPWSVLFLNRGGNRRAFRLAGARRDHFHCTVEPSPGHIRCRKITPGLGIPLTPGRARNPISWKRGFRGPKTQFPVALKKAGKRSFRSKNPHFPCVPLQKKKGFFLTENSLCQNEGKRGVLGPRNPLFQEIGFRSLVWGRGNPSPGLQSKRGSREPTP